MINGGKKNAYIYRFSYAARQTRQDRQTDVVVPKLKLDLLSHFRSFKYMKYMLIYRSINGLLKSTIYLYENKLVYYQYLILKYTKFCLFWEMI